MMLNTRQMSLAALAGAALLGLVACGGSTEPADTTSAPATTTTESSTEAPPNTSATTSAAPADTISKEDAEQVVFDDAGVTRDQVTAWDKSELDTDDNRQIWEIEFDIDATEYEYDIDAVTGEILKKEIG